MATAGTVTLNLDADSVKLIQGLQKAQNQTKKSAGAMRKEMGQAFKAIAKSAAVMGAAMVAATKVSVEFGDKIGKTSKAVGLTAEQFQEFSFAAKRGGVEASQFASNMTAFVKRVGEAKTGTGPLVSGLKNLDTVLLDNIKNSRNQDEAFRLVADAIQNSKSATERAAIANAAFSRSGIGMVNMLSDGSDGLNSMAQKARDLGVVLSDELVAKSEDAADKFGDLQEVMKVSIAAEVLENADSIVTLTTALIGFVGIVGKATKGWSDWMAMQGISLKSIDDIRQRGEVLTRRRVELEKELLKLQAYPKNNLQEIEKTQAAINNIIREQIALQDKAIEIQKGGSAPKPAAHTQPPVTIDVPETQANADKVAEIIAGMMQDIKQFGMTDDQKALINLIDKGATEDQIAVFTQAQNELRILADIQAEAKAGAEERNALEQEYADLLAGTLTAAEMHHQAVGRVDQLYAMGIIPNAEEYLAILESINDGFAATQQSAADSQDQMTEFTKQAARNMQTAFADFLFDPMEEGFDGLARNFAKTLQRMAADAAASAIMNAIISGMAGSGSGWTVAVGTALSGTRAAGGPVLAGGSYLVGEEGPEVLNMGNTSGHIVPNHAIGGGGSVTVNIDAREQDDPARILALVPVIQSQIEQTISLKMKRGFL